jgi:nitrogen regulatory protein PII
VAISPSSKPNGGGFKVMLHPAIKVSIVTEKFIQDRVCRVAEECGAKGYTLVPAGGKGLHHFHATESTASVIDDFANIKIEAIVRDRATGERIAARLMDEFFQDYPGIVYLENVEVWREGRF